MADVQTGLCLIDNALTLVLNLETTLDSHHMTVLANHSDSITILGEEILIHTVDGVGAVVYDGVRLQNILQAVGDLLLLQGGTTTCELVANLTRCGFVLVNLGSDGERLVLVAELDETLLCTLEAGGVVVVLQSLVAGQEEGELTLHGLQIGIVVQTHVVGTRRTVVDGPLHHEVGLTDVGGRGDRGIVGRTIDVAHHINRTVASQQTGVDLVNILGIEELFLGIVAELGHLAGH